MPDTYPAYDFTEIDPRRVRLYEQFNRYLTERHEALDAGESEKLWDRDYSSQDAYRSSIEPNRERWIEFLTEWPRERCELEPRVEVLGEFPAFRLERVWMRVRPGIEMDCLVLVPLGDGPRAAVLCQHGWNGTPEEACGFIHDADEMGYRRCGTKLAEAGFVVIAPHEAGGCGTPVRDYRYAPGKPQEAQFYARSRLHRRAALLGVNLLGMEMYHLSRAVDYLQTRPEVDPERIGMYGLSQGGQSALWLPAADTRVKASVCSGYFNHRMVKLVQSRQGHYIDSQEEERFYHGQLLAFSDWQIASLICPRPFMVESGLQDGNVHHDLVEAEFARAKHVYEQLGLADRCELNMHDGKHIFRCVESLAFLKKWLGNGDAS